MSVCAFGQYIGARRGSMDDGQKHQKRQDAKQHGGTDMSSSVKSRRRLQLGRLERGDNRMHTKQVGNVECVRGAGRQCRPRRAAYCSFRTILLIPCT